MVADTDLPRLVLLGTTAREARVRDAAHAVKATYTILGGVLRRCDGGTGPDAANRRS